jgi:hypothetical protein
MARYPSRMVWRPKVYCVNSTERLFRVVVEFLGIIGRKLQGRLVMSKALILGATALALSAGAASAQVYVSPGYGYGYGYGAPLYDYAAPAYGYAATAPLYNFAAPAYAAPATAGTTVIIVTPGAPAYTAPPVGSGYYNYAPGYGGGYGRWRAGYWGGYGYGWR